MTDLDQQRRERFQRVIEPMRTLSSFAADELKALCSEESPAFVTRVLNQLADDGILQIDSAGGTVTWRREPSSFVADAWIDRKVHGVQITQSPESDRPRERLLRLGPKDLKTSELLAILVRTGRPGESALQIGEKIANRFGEGLLELPGQGFGELKEIIKSLSESAYCQIMAGIELGRRFAAGQKSRVDRVRITSSSVAVEYCRQEFSRLVQDGSQEEFHIVTLDTKKQPINSHRISVGTLDASLVHPREVFRAAIRDAASSILIVHNHPSGDPTPSREDYQVMRMLGEAGEILGIALIDSIIVASSDCMSMRDRSPTS